jgi:hypothetical protein
MRLCREQELQPTAETVGAAIRQKNPDRTPEAWSVALFTEEVSARHAATPPAPRGAADRAWMPIRHPRSGLRRGARARAPAPAHHR